ncbi:EpsG family protein [Phnomibacter sp. MR]|uniref:EpsG family protein n=1 Tax=Phnomibacter sp. MR TaxID=3042318 RepID=UPI003A7FC4ED
MLLVAFVFSYLVIALFAFYSVVSDAVPKVKPSIQVLGLVWFMAMCVFFIVFRSYDTLGDTSVYVNEIFSEIGKSPSLSSYNTQALDTAEPLFYWLTKLGYITGSSRVYLLLAMMAFIGPLMVSIFLQWRSHFFLVLFSFVSLFVFYSLSMNIIRNGISVGWWLLGLVMLYQRRWIALSICVFISVGFHFSSLFFWVLVLLALVVRNIYVIAILGLVALVAAFLEFDLSELLLVASDSGLANELIGMKLARYGNKVFDAEYNTGFRADFVIFNLFFLALALWYKQVLNYKNHFYDFLVRLYIILSAIFFLSFQIPGADRIGILSWIIIPFISMFPIHEPPLRNNIHWKLTLFCITVIQGLVSIYIIKHLFQIS